METLASYKDSILDQLATTGVDILKALAIFVIGWLVIKLLLSGLRRTLKFLKINDLGKKLNDIEIVEGKKLNIDITKVFIAFVKWTLVIILIIIVSEMMGLTIISEEIGNILSYLPLLLSALVIFMIGLFIANFVKKSIHTFFKSLNLSGAKLVSQLVFFIILAIVSITALNQAGVNTDIITSNMNLIFGACVGAIAIAVGLGARAIVADLLRTYYVRRTYELGQHIKFNKVEGEIMAIDDIAMTLKTENGKLIVPIKDIVENQIEVQG